VFVLALDHLCVGQHGLAVGTPVDRRRLVLDESGLVESLEQPLVPPIVVRLTGGDFARPVVAKAHLLEFLAHAPDTRLRPGLGIGLSLERGVLGGEAERVPAHRVEHVVALHSAIASVGVRDRVVSDVTHVERARRVGKHAEDVGRIVGVLVKRVDVVALPDVLPELLYLRVIVVARHYRRDPLAFTQWAGYIIVRPRTAASSGSAVDVWPRASFDMWLRAS